LKPVTTRHMGGAKPVGLVSRGMAGGCLNRHPNKA
jgi:hypothetical protein